MITNNLPALILAVLIPVSQPTIITQHAIQKETAVDERRNIEMLLSTYEQALNSSNAVAAQSLYTDDGMFMPAAAPSAVGKEQILNSYEFIFSQIQLSIKFQVDEIEVSGTMAFATTRSEGTTLIRAANTTVPEKNRELFVFVKQADDWKIARYMFNKSEVSE